MLLVRLMMFLLVGSLHGRHSPAPSRAAFKRAVSVSLARALLLFSCIAANVSAQQGQWVPLGPDYAGVIALERDPSNLHSIYAGTFYGGLYKSGDDGASWSYLASPADSTSVQAIAFDTTRVGTLYIGTFEKGIFKSADGGQTWQVANTGLVDKNITAIAVDPFDSNRVLTASAQGGRGSPRGYSSAGAVSAQACIGGYHPDVAGLARDTGAGRVIANTSNPTACGLAVSRLLNRKR